MIYSVNQIITIFKISDTYKYFLSDYIIFEFLKYVDFILGKGFKHTYKNSNNNVLFIFINLSICMLKYCLYYF